MHTHIYINIYIYMRVCQEAPYIHKAVCPEEALTSC